MPRFFFQALHEKPPKDEAYQFVVDQPAKSRHFVFPFMGKLHFFFKLRSKLHIDQPSVEDAKSKASYNTSTTTLLNMNEVKRIHSLEIHCKLRV